MIRKAAWTIGGLVPFYLNAAALHDILKGNEPDLRNEYAMLILAGLGLVAYAAVRIARSREGVEDR